MAKVLSIVVPSYNVEAYLERGLRSLYDERLAGALEVIIVDDGSTDTTPAIAQRFVDREPRIFKLVSKENGGHGSTINTGLAVATGKYFRVVDGDDWVDTEGLVRLTEQLRALDADLVVDEKREVDMKTGASKLFPLVEGTVTGQVLPFSTVCRDPAISSQIMIHTLTVRTQLMRDAGVRLLEHTFYEDYEYVVKASVPAASIVFFDLEVYQYLVGNANQSVSHANYVKRWDDHERVVLELLHYLGECRAHADDFTPEALAYLSYKVHLIIDTHYNIALLFDSDRRRGRARARAFREELKRIDEEQWRWGNRRYRQALALNRLGIGYDTVGRLRGRRHV